MFVFLVPIFVFLDRDLVPVVLRVGRDDRASSWNKHDLGKLGRNRDFSSDKGLRERRAGRRMEARFFGNQLKLTKMLLTKVYFW